MVADGLIVVGVTRTTWLFFGLGTCWWKPSSPKSFQSSVEEVGYFQGTEVDRTDIKIITLRAGGIVIIPMVHL
jgi:hypothetical protein